MANIVQSDIDWTSNELENYFTKIVTVGAADFFGCTNLPASRVDPVILNNLITPISVNLPRDARLFFRYMHNVFIRDPDIDEAAITDFTSHLLGNILRYDEPDRLFQQRRTLQFIVSGKRVKTRLDITLRDGQNHLLFVHGAKRPLATDADEPRLIAGAIAAFHTDDSRRIAVGLPRLASKTYIGIVMIGVAPRFYKIPVTPTLVRAVATGQFPEAPTIVHRFIPPVTRLDTFMEEGMQPLDNRGVCFQCFEALRALL